MKTNSRPTCSSVLAARFFVFSTLFHGHFASADSAQKVEKWGKNENCPDGGLALTPALYESTSIILFRQDVTCIPKQAFKEYANGVTLTGLPNLKDIGVQAFYNVQGTLHFTGAYPKLKSIQKSAFSRAVDNDSIIDFRSGQLNDLTFVDPDAFNGAQPVHITPGPYPKYVR